MTSAACEEVLQSSFLCEDGPKSSTQNSEENETTRPVKQRRLLNYVRPSRQRKTAQVSEQKTLKRSIDALLNPSVLKRTKVDCTVSAEVQR